MSLPLLVIVSGPPCSGKTTLARWLAQELALPLITKDAIKELLFDNLGWSDRAWSNKLGRATYPLVYYFVESQLAAGRSFIVESNFEPQFATSVFAELKHKYPFEPFQVQCHADGALLVKRFKERSESGARHPGHVDPLIYDEVGRVLLKGKLASLDIGGTVVEVDTTDFEKIDYSGLLNKIRLHLNSTQGTNFTNAPEHDL